ncbi:hypothetical protein RFI_15057 [Reticulomyxa filosa]|uniref:Uncharacterized protein n=1 Tax=Reticulomyxa filosa TaxID=46433 RepID=X6N8A7_RETFI|nr:hypothetical protein RFI_15057 [Reticulomyxa filosa]|eukprot:ETO22148.1 hypothetical protein RFI_15057 [Reticulomyxa filosa]
MVMMVLAMSGWTLVGFQKWTQRSAEQLNQNKLSRTLLEIKENTVGGTCCGMAAASNFNSKALVDFCGGCVRQKEALLGSKHLETEAIKTKTIFSEKDADDTCCETSLYLGCSDWNFNLYCSGY